MHWTLHREEAPRHAGSPQLPLELRRTEELDSPTTGLRMIWYHWPHATWIPDDAHRLAAFSNDDPVRGCLPA